MLADGMCVLPEAMRELALKISPARIQSVGLQLPGEGLRRGLMPA